MKVPGVDGVDFINIGPGYKTELGRLLHLSTEQWFSTPHGKCLTLIGYHFYNTVRYVIQENNLDISDFKDIELLRTADHREVRFIYDELMAKLTDALGTRPRNVRYPIDWQIPSIYARLSMHDSPIASFYMSKLPIVWLDRFGNDICDSRGRMGGYIETILMLRNDHAKYHS